MGSVIYSVASSLDGYHTDLQGDFSWTVPDDEVIAALTADAASVSTYLYGRRMYETMAVWETEPSAAAQSPESAAYAHTWKRARKVVFSSTLGAVWTKRTRLEHTLTAEAIERAKAESHGDLTIEGPTIAKSALHMELVDVVELLLCPVVLGGGMRVFPEGLWLGLRLVRERAFGNGMVQITYERSRS
ncbi:MULTISPECIES: dihydrofolate reductase family protein [unclassified Microbacterium]|uniref:dihydrofolate reductase family protein n=1 Tax=unclassified Microbacterium TaxID=2609290 RepID=UPI00214B2272|nr:MULTISPECIES: dihydrofolate reductase family protein [unclassified Microbacterium]MCR2783957.1 dihydrofolate reductase family protein [Microbacterium sp. zg.B96]WIM15199.1 dihydrofolate reductase family protein [Microbacterium sp. zg-B96]